jgi:hypothetical protein
MTRPSAAPNSVRMHSLPSVSPLSEHLTSCRQSTLTCQILGPVPLEQRSVCRSASIMQGRATGHISSDVLFKEKFHFAVFCFYTMQFARKSDSHMTRALPCFDFGQEGRSCYCSLPPCPLAPLPRAKMSETQFECGFHVAATCAYPSIHSC